MKGKGGVIQTQGARESLSLGQEKEPYIEAPFIYLNSPASGKTSFFAFNHFNQVIENPGQLVRYPLP